jgi:hypothetical protein
MLTELVADDKCETIIATEGVLSDGVQEMRHESVQKAILALNGTPLDELKSRLTAEIGTPGQVTVEWSYDLFHVRLFRANHSALLRGV